MCRGHSAQHLQIIRGRISLHQHFCKHVSIVLWQQHGEEMRVLTRFENVRLSIPTTATSTTDK